MEIDLLRLGNQVICCVALSRQDNNHIIALQIGFCNNTGNIADALGVLDTAAAEFLYDQTHGCSLSASDCPEGQGPPHHTPNQANWGISPAPADRPVQTALLSAPVPHGLLCNL